MKKKIIIGVAIILVVLVIIVATILINNKGNDKVAVDNTATDNIIEENNNTKNNVEEEINTDEENQKIDEIKYNTGATGDSNIYEVQIDSYDGREVVVVKPSIKYKVAFAGMVKNDRHKTADLMTENDEKIGLDPKSEGFYLLQRIQDEVHRFAITFHRQVRSKNSLASRLERIQGVGPKTRIKLLRNYGSLKNISAASVEDLESLGISKKVAQTIKLSLKNQS